MYHLRIIAPVRRIDSTRDKRRYQRHADARQDQEQRQPQNRPAVPRTTPWTTPTKSRSTKSGSKHWSPWRSMMNNTPGSASPSPMSWSRHEIRFLVFETLIPFVEADRGGGMGGVGVNYFRFWTHDNDSWEIIYCANMYCLPSTCHKKGRRVEILSSCLNGAKKGMSQKSIVKRNMAIDRRDSTPLSKSKSSAACQFFFGPPLMADKSKHLEKCLCGASTSFNLLDP